MSSGGAAASPASGRTALAEARRTAAVLGAQRDLLREENRRLRAREDDLALARERFGAVFELAPLALLTLTPGGLVQEANAAAPGVLDRTRRQILGQPLATLLRMEDRRVFRRKLAALGPRQTLSLEVRVASAQGGSFPASLRARKADGGLVYAVLVDQRQRERDERERHALLVRAEAARAASEAKDRFLAELSHELRTPLAPAVLATDALVEALASLRLPRLVGELLDTIRNGVAWELRLIDDLLDLTRIAHGKMVVEKAPTDLLNVVREAEALIAPALAEKKLSLDVHLPDRSVIVQGDSHRLRQVLCNLLRNAVEASPIGGRIRVVVRGDAREGVVLTVADQGRGIAADDLERIFHRFSQARASQGGLGLGLAIARGLVEAHGGRIYAASGGLGQGATFSVELPTAVANRRGARSVPATAPAPGRVGGGGRAADSPAPAAPGRGGRAADAPAPAAPGRGPLPLVPASAQAGPGARILLVEDHRPTAAMLVHLLRRDGHEVIHAGSVADALAVAPDRFDLLVSDLGLPDGSGHDVVHGVHSRCGRRIPAIALTGYGRRQDLAQSQRAGFVAHLLKPVRLGELRAAIERVAGGLRAGPGSPG